jgi:hypothetical protein
MCIACDQPGWINHPPSHRLPYGWERMTSYTIDQLVKAEKKKADPDPEFLAALEGELAERMTPGNEPFLGE